VKPDRFFNRPDAVPHVDARIPEKMEHRACGGPRLFQEAPRLAQHHDVDVGVRAELTPPVSAEREYRIVSIVPAGRQSQADRIASSVIDVSALHVANPSAPLRWTAAISAFRARRNDFNDRGSGLHG